MIALGEKIPVKGGIVGVVKYIGPIDDKEGTWVGLELDKERGKHNGTYNGKKYFESKGKYGIFVRYEMLQTIVGTEPPISLQPMQDSPLKDDSLIFKDCTVKVDNLKKENACYLPNVSDLIKENLQLSKLNEYVQEINKLKKIIKSKETELEEVKTKHKSEMEMHKKLLDQETLKSNKLDKSLASLKGKFIKVIEGFSRETSLTLCQLENQINAIGISDKPDENELKAHKKICKTFKDLLYSFIDKDNAALDKNIASLRTLL